MNDELDTIAQRQLNVVYVDASAARTPATIAASLHELAADGIRIANPSALTDSIAGRVAAIRSCANLARGGRRTRSPLFAGFPDQLPDWDDAYVRFALGVVNAVHQLAVDGDINWASALDHTSLGWWPASSIDQDPDRAALADAAQQLRARDTSVVWVTLTVHADTDRRADLTGWARDLCARTSSSRADEVTDLDTILDEFGVGVLDSGTYGHNELAAHVWARLFRDAATGNSDAAAAFLAAVTTPDDLARTLAVTAGADAAFTGGTRFDLISRRGRRLVAAVLDTTPRPGDLWRKRGWWLGVLRSAHIGEFAGAFPNAAALAKRLRAERYDSTTTASRFEAALADGRLGDAVTLAAAEAPGLLIRNAARIARHLDPLAADRLTGAFTSAAARAPWTLTAVATRTVADNAASFPRAAVTKSGRTLVVPAQTPADPAVAATLAAAVSAGSLERLSRLATLAGERIWVDRTCATLLVPASQRSADVATRIIERGSHIAAAPGPVLRLFVHWEQDSYDKRSDLDLSVVAYDADMNYVSHVSWTRLAGGPACVHSGDLTSAPPGVGASEFVDINLAGLPSDWRYIIPSVQRFCGPAFGQLREAVAGWMMRDNVDASRQTFDVATVDVAFTLNGSGRSAVPFMYDTAAAEIVYLDAYLPGAPGATATGSAGRFSELARAAVGRAALRPSITDLVVAHAIARGAELVATPAEATITVGCGSGFTHDAYRPVSLLAFFGDTI